MLRLLCRLCLTSDEIGLCGVALAGRDASLGGDMDAVLTEAEKQLGEYFAGVRTVFDLPMSLHGSPFDCTVWRTLGEIAYGEIRSYGQLAAQLGRPKSARAVGGACGRNPLLIVLPCHRVVSSAGALTGFAAGIAAKQLLLVHEGWRVADGKLIK